MRKLLELSSGAAFVTAGMLFLLTPVPLGVPFILLGLFFLVRASARMRNAVRSMRARYPMAEAALFREHPGLPRGARYLLLTTRPRHVAGVPTRAARRLSEAAISATRDSG